MTSNQIVLHVAAALDQLVIPYMLVGSYSSNVHGIPRSTNDADFVIELPSTGVPITELSKLLGPDFRVDPQLLFETVTGNYRYIITHPSSGFKVELFHLSTDPHHQERFRRRVRRMLDHQEVWFQTAEDVIIQKIRWYARIQRAKDRDDVLDVIDTQSPAILDLVYIRHWCDQHATREILEKLLHESESSEAT
ncbi:MAG TPA: hypothetical protein VFE58_11740 [Tepidisphaeraceae bacterium]|jgi:hypothetical protein|nr:hypothetical protein [Tepidisphaeraceae bacterium]